MIHGIGTDIVAVRRMHEALERHGEAFAARILSASELAEFRASKDAPRLLAKRFAAKEAFAKAYGTGIRAPLTLCGIAVTHDELGKPSFTLDEAISAVMDRRGLTACLSISDEKEYVVAFAVITST